MSNNRTITTDIYTEQEREFLTKACDLLDIAHDYIKQSEPMAHYSYKLEGTDKQLALLSSLMAYNYTKNF